MVNEKQQATIGMDADPSVLAATRCRLLSQEWAEDSIIKLTDNLAHLHTLPNTTSIHNLRSSIAHVLILLDGFATAAEDAATFNAVITHERAQIAVEVAHINADIVREAQQVEQLRGLLEREKRLVDRRAQYDALAKLILDYPSCEQSTKELEDAQKDANAVDDDIKCFDDTKAMVSKELRLLAQCAAALDDTMGKLTGLIAQPANQARDTLDPMDTA